MFTIAILAAAIVSTLTIDLGPAARAFAEREGSKRLNRPVHVGRLSIHVLRGRVLLEDFSIEGRAAGDRPFFTAERLSISLDWSKAVARRPELVVTSVELVGWQMLVEEWRDGHSFPKLHAHNRRESPRQGETIHHDAQLPSRLARTVLVREPRNAVERRRAEHRPRHRLPPVRAALSRAGELRRRNRAHPGSPADVDEHEGTVCHRRQQPADGTHRHRHGWGKDRCGWHRGYRSVARDAVRRQVARALSAHARDLFHGRALAACRRRRFQRSLSPVQGGTRSGGHVQERCARRVCVSFPVAAGFASLDAQPVRSEECPGGSLRGRRQVRLLDQAARGARNGGQPGSTRSMPTSTSCR